MKYCCITGPAGIGKSHALAHRPVSDEVQIVDLLETIKPEIQRGTKALVLDHADCEPDAAKALVTQAEELDLEYACLVGCEPSDLDSIVPGVSWELDIRFSGGFQDLVIEICSNGKKARYTTDDLPRQVEGIDGFLSQIRQDLAA
ncbi:MAG TPA: hypothetical protein ENI98_10110 [Gammaproteobacteria bacterium]|nr:hypothetical protein [Gammaproteobacteria bacterium]